MPRKNACMKNTTVKGKKRAVNTYENGKLSGTCGRKKQYATKTYQNNVHEFPLVVRQEGTTAIQVLLDTRSQKLCQLLEKEPLYGTPKSNATGGINFKIYIELTDKITGSNDINNHARIKGVLKYVFSGNLDCRS